MWVARSEHDGGELRRLTLNSLRSLPDASLDEGEPVARPCSSSVACTAAGTSAVRNGVPVFEALAEHVAPDLLWQSSH